MKITIIGTGYVGLVSGACFSEFGVHVTCVDRDEKKIQALNAGIIPIYEPGLEALVVRNKEQNRLHFTTDLKVAIADTQLVFIAVGTPSRRGDGHADLQYVYGAVKEVARALTHPVAIVTKSTVPVGTGREILRLVKEHRPDLAISVASNPEFLREGSAIEDFMRPDRVVVGTDCPQAQELLRDLYRPLYLLETPMVMTNLETAEMIKYAANAFLATKIAFINEISDLCEASGANVQAVAKGIGLDKRIGSKFLHVGPGYGGSCFPKDTLALTQTAQIHKKPLTIVESVVAANNRRKEEMAQRIINLLPQDGQRTVSILGVTFKPNTDDCRESPSLTIIPLLQKAGILVRASDPVGIEEAQKLLTDVQWFADLYEAIRGADAAVILTEWNVFRALDLGILKDTMRTPLLIDFRNIYVPDHVTQAGLQYYSLGRSV